MQAGPAGEPPYVATKCAANRRVTATLVNAGEFRPPFTFCGKPQNWSYVVTPSEETALLLT